MRIAGMAAVLALGATALGAGQAAAQSAGDPTPLVVANAHGFQCLLGVAHKGRFIPPEDASRAIVGGEAYRFYDLQGHQGAGVGGPPQDGEEPCDWMVSTNVQPLPGGDRNVVGVGGAWNAMPARLEIASTTQQVYIDAVADLLRANGIAKPDVVLTQVLRTDLNGDGVDEVLISSERSSGEWGITVSAGDYSVVMLRQLIDGEVVTTVLDSAMHIQDDEFAIHYSLAVLGVLDLDGDGDMEIVTSSIYYEGAFYNVIDVGANGAEFVLGCGCGL